MSYKKMPMFLGVEDVSRVPGVVAIGISGVVALGDPDKVTLWVPSDVSLGIPGVIASVFLGVFYLGSTISVPGKAFF